MRLAIFTLGAAAVFSLTGCDWMPGKPTRSEQWKAPHDVTDFKTLYSLNCQGCHGSGKEIAGSISLDNPAYLSVVSRETLQDVIANGVHDSLMPAFSEEHGGMLTDKQIGILVDGIMAWAPKTPLPGPLPPYAAVPGNAGAGQAVYQEYEAAIKKSAGDKIVANGFLANPVFLGLSTDQYLRTLVIAGRPELGVPDWRNAIPGRPLSDQDIADVVAYLISQRKNELGQPLQTTGAAN